ncbi:MAG: uracil-DNA glycosylase [Antricoccus sp.]
MTNNSFAELIHPSWTGALGPVSEQIASMGTFLRSEIAAGRSYLPAGDRILRAFGQPLDEIKVLLVGQDPYPTPGHAVGLSFSVEPALRPLPRSLQNIYKEYVADLGYPMPTSGDLSSWERNGVLLLNRCLTVEPGKPASHRGKGWEKVTDAAIDALVQRGGPLVALLWGKDAQSLTARLGHTPIVASAHPSPMSADRGFFGSRPFTRINELIAEHGGTTIDWRLS